MTRKIRKKLEVIAQKLEKSEELSTDVRLASLLTSKGDLHNKGGVCFELLLTYLRIQVRVWP